MPLIVRDSDGYMWLYPYDNETFGARSMVGWGWNFDDYFVGDWKNNGTDDLLVRDSSGNMRLYPFENGSFYHIPGSGQIVGTGFTNYTHYFVGQWTNY